MQKKQEEISQSTSAAEKAIENLQSNNDLIVVCYIDKYFIRLLLIHFMHSGPAQQCYSNVLMVSTFIVSLSFSLQ